MRDLEEGIDIVQIELPQPENLYGIWMEGGKADSSSTRAEEEVVIVSNGIVPCCLNRSFTYFVVRGVAVIAGLSKLSQRSAEL